MGAAVIQANASVLAHIACGDSELADGGWECNCDPDQGNCLKHNAHDDDSQGGDMLELHHHHHAEGPSSPLIASTGDISHTLSATRLTAPAKAKTLQGIDPSLTDQPPKI